MSASANTSDSSAAVEIERRRLADLLEVHVSSPLNLLLAQAAVYENALSGNTQALMAVSVLASLARSVQQSVRDLRDNLYPAVLDSLGLEPALEVLAAQTQRAHGVNITLLLERQRDRPPPAVELALYRAAQDMLHRAVFQARASQVVLRLLQRDGWLTFALADNGLVEAHLAALRPALAHVEQLGGQIETRSGEGWSFELLLRFATRPPVELTTREIEVLALVADGLTNKAIASRLHVSARTVNFHLDNIYSKLGVSSRTEAVVIALRSGWVSPAE
jgi:DNA-binding CsgD family transcriptional regulator/signal transduction histidine kinase